MTATAAGVEVRLALRGALRLARGDRRGLACFDPSLEGFWRSFRAAFIGYPFYMALLLMRVSDAEWDRSGLFRILAVETIAYVINWAAFPLIILPFCRWLDRERRFFGFMTVYNWCQLPEMALFVLIGFEAESGLLPPGTTQAIQIVAAAAVLIYEWYIARVALETTATAATAIVLANLVLGVAISQIADGLY
ncbi:MAG: hypothetical protein JO267_14105 [Alphaproteobacteria bacterium]|nr:hypothetical protein [Alphaproteobacteria bacterium]